VVVMGRQGTILPLHTAPRLIAAMFVFLVPCHLEGTRVERVINKLFGSLPLCAPCA
jgi:hypothetical protein